MADMRAMNALFQMCSDLKEKLENLKAVVKSRCKVTLPYK